MAEWAQLRAAPTTRTHLERGVWYQVRTQATDGLIGVVGPNAVELDLDSNLVRVIDREPDMVTRVQEVEFHAVRPGEPSPGLSYYGVCPRGHWIQDLPATAREARCGQCSRVYRVEDEEPG